MTHLRNQSLLLLLGTALLTVSGVKAAPETAIDPEKFVESVGVNVKLAYADTPYNDFARVKLKLNEAGIRHIRDGVTNPEKVNELGAAGISLMAIIQPAKAGMSRDEMKAEMLDGLRKVRGSLRAIEGPNEPDGSYNTQLQPFPQAVIDYQKLLFDSVKADADLKKFPVVATSIGFPPNSAKTPDVACDWGNTHSYHGARPPETNDQNLDLPKFYLANAAIQAPGKPVVCTETGNPTNQYDDPNLWMPRTSEWAHGKYTLRTLCHYFSQGIVATYLHELIDEHPQKNVAESNFGILRHDWSAKPAYTGIKNLLNLLADKPAPGAKPFVPGALDFEMGGEKGKVRHLLFQKRNGVFYLVLWQPARSYEPDKKLDLGVADAQISLKFAAPISNALVYSPISFERAAGAIKNPQLLEIGVPDHPIVLELIPRGPDLIVSDFALVDAQTGGAPQVGKPAKFKALLKNKGAFPTVPNVPHAVTFFDETGGAAKFLTFGVARTLVLKAGEETEVEANGTWTPTQAGALKVQALADDVDRIGEESDGNNSLSKTISVSP